MSRATARDRVGDFDTNSPRPPVPGEETDPGCCNSSSIFCPPQTSYRCTPRVPVLSSSIHSAALLEGKAPLGFEPEGSCANDHGSCSPFYEGTRSPPQYLQWAKNLYYLLDDQDGVTLFKRYLEREGKAHADVLDFWFACKGLTKKTDDVGFQRCVKIIWRKYMPVLQIDDDLRKEVTQNIRSNNLWPGLFDKVQAEVARRINETTYPNFLKSDIYLNYVRQMQLDCSSPYSSSSGSSSSSAGRDLSLCGGSTFLQTLHEDAVLEIAQNSLPLTRGSLAATESRRVMEVRPKPEAYAGLYLQHGAPMNTRVYSSYNPVSRQDSELQSLSSEARTDSDAMSCTDNSVDGNNSSSHHRNQRRLNQKHYRAIRENASINRDSTEPIIPRPQRGFNKDWTPLEPREFAELLTRKLEAYLKQQEEREKLEKKIKAEDSKKFPEDATLFAKLLRERIPADDFQDNQAILDQHCMRVWSDDYTPCRSPKISSPKSKSPDARRKLTGQVVPHPYQVKPAHPSKYPKKEKDVFSTFSADSGNIHDFPDNQECTRHFPKSKSFPDHVDTQNTHSGFEGRYRSKQDTGFKRLSNKMTQSTEFTDSGVSVISDTLPCSSKHAADWQMSRMKESSDRTGSKHRSLKQPMTSSSSSSCQHRHGRKSERSGSLERCLQSSSSYVPESNIQTSSLNTKSQLEEARRKLIEDDSRSKLLRQRIPSSSKTQLPLDPSLSNQSTLRKSVKRTEPSPIVQRPTEQEYMTVTYSFWDEDVPYRTKVSGTNVTLKQFKDLLPRKGNYRYFFKTECAEVESKAIHEEVFDENQILPLWEGKLIAQVKPLN